MMKFCDKLIFAVNKEKIADRWLLIHSGFKIKPERGELAMMGLLKPEDIQKALERDAVPGSEMRV